MQSKEVNQGLLKSSQMINGKPGVLPVGSSSVKLKRVYYPEYWKKKKLNPEFVKELEETANREPSVTDDFGAYKEGTFLHGSAVVKVNITDGLWSVAIHSQYQIGHIMVQDVRYKYVPDDCLMATLLPSRSEKTSENTVVIYQIPGSLTDKSEEKEP